jgi:hypothetical protein
MNDGDDAMGLPSHGLGRSGRRLRRARSVGLAAVVLASLALVLAAFAIPTDDARAAGLTKQVTVLELQVPASVYLGSHPLATVRLTSAGAPVAGQLISVELGTNVTEQVTTGADGSATADIARNLPIGTYEVTATFAGTPTYQSSSSPTVAFVVVDKLPTVLEIQVPASMYVGPHPRATVRLTSDGAPVAGQLINVELGAKVTQRVTTGADGSATADIARNLAPGSYQVRATFAGTPTYQSSSSPAVGFTVLDKLATTLELAFPASVLLGAHPLATVRLTSTAGPVPGQVISLHLGTKIIQQVTTGADGSATADVARNLPAGTYQITATFAGTPAIRSTSSGTIAFKVGSVRLTIVTVPPLPGLPLVRVGNGATLKTGADGKVTVTIARAGDVTLRLTLPKDDATQRLRLDRWDDGSTALVRTIRVPDVLQVTVGLQISHPVRLQFAASDGGPIDATEVPSVAVSDSAGTEQTLIGPGPHWLRSNAISRLTTGLVSTPLEYRVADVPMSGVSVVTRGQQRFVADGPVTVQISLLVFNLAIQGRDGLLKTPSGSRATITAVDGSERVVQLDRAGGATIRLPRGQYRITVGGAVGISLSTTVALSRDQIADVLLISPADLAILLAVGLGLAIGLIVIGRPHVLRRRRGASPGGAGDSSGGPSS